MPSSLHVHTQGRRDSIIALGVFVLCLAFNVWGLGVGWRSLNLPGHEFRQAQTALSAFHIQHDHNFSIDYPTPVLGKPWAIPLEFPLYQWSVVAISNATGWGLIESGRTVSAVCFYLSLPALFLLLGNLKVAAGHRWLVLAIVVTSPVYIFYGRSFLIESMALMFSLWFWVAFERVVLTRDWRWLVVANLAGAAAGLVKITTFSIYLLPAALWAVRHLFATGSRENRWLKDVGWMAAAVGLPLMISLWWGHHADTMRQLNPLAHFLVSKNLYGFTFGTWETRFSQELWMQKWSTSVFSVTWWPVILVTLAAGFIFARVRWRQSLAMVGWFVLPLAIFPILYGFHDYYFFANGVLLLLALGLMVVGIAESTRSVWLAAFVALIVAGGQGYRYLDGYFQTQREISDGGGGGLTRSLRGLLKPNEVIVAVGQQWNPMLPFYAQRRAMMIREEDEIVPERLDAAFAALAGEKIGALLISSTVHVPAEFLKRSIPLGLGAQPIYRCEDVTVYLRDDSRDESVRLLQQNNYSGVEWIPGVEPNPDRLAGTWYDVESLAPERQAFFGGMNPRPVRFFSSYGPAVGYDGGKTYFGAHPSTRLVFQLAMGEHQLRTTASFPAENYGSGLPFDQRTDGVEITLIALTNKGAGRRVLFTRLMNPRDLPGDRGEFILDIPFTLDQAGEVELYFGPGPAGRDTRDSILVGPLEIK